MNWHIDTAGTIRRVLICSSLYAVVVHAVAKQSWIAGPSLAAACVGFPVIGVVASMRRGPAPARRVSAHE